METTEKRGRGRPVGSKNVASVQKRYTYRNTETGKNACNCVQHTGIKMLEVMCSHHNILTLVETKEV